MLSVALSAARRRGGDWTRAWLVQAAPMLARRAPQLAVELLQRELETPGGGSRAGQQRLPPHGIKQGVRSRRGPRATSG